MIRVLKLRNIRLKEQKKLNENNLCLYEHITAYIKATNLTMYEKEEVLHQIMDMLLEAQYENRDKSFIVGDDYKKFCQSIVDEYMNSKSKVYIILDYMQRYILWFSIGVGLDAIYNLFSVGSLKVTINDIMTWNTFALVIIFITKRMVREAIEVPISGKSKIKFNANINSSSKTINIWCFIFLLSLGVQLGARYIFNIDPYNYFVNLNTSIFIILPMIIGFLVLVSVYKINYNRR